MSPEQDRGQDPHHTAGHTVLAIPVPALEQIVQERTAFYDASWLSTDPAFSHAHITVLSPWVARPTAQDLAAIDQIAREADAFEVLLGDVAEFPSGVIYARPEPDAPLRALTDRIVAAFPHHPPYGGRYDVAPHVTLDRRSDTVDRALVASWVSDVLPHTLSVERLDLQWWGNHECHLIQSWQLGSGAERVTP